MAEHWMLDPSITFLNHGSFGACPRGVLEAQAAFRDRLEREPVKFFVREGEALLDAGRLALAEFLRADPDGLVFVTNATMGVNSVLRSLQLEPSGELLITDHGYNAVSNAVRFAAERNGCKAVVARVPFPIDSPDQVLEALMARATPRTRLLVIDHVTSPTALVFPIERIVRAFAERGVDTLVDGAHAPGMLATDLETLGAAYYTGNCHKWMCAPKGAGFLYVRGDRRDRIRPLSISHGANSIRTDRSRLHLEFDWIGTTDTSAYLCVPEAIRFMGSLLPGGWSTLRARNHQLALEARALIGERLGVVAPCPPTMVGSMAALPLPVTALAPGPKRLFDPLQEALFDRFQVEVPVFPVPALTVPALTA